MPYEIRDNGDGTVRVVNKDNGEVKAMHTTRRKAKKQIRLLNAEEHGWKPGRRIRRRG